MRKTRKSKIKRRITRKGGNPHNFAVATPARNGLNVGEEIVTKTYGYPLIGEIKSTRFNKNLKKIVSVKLFNNINDEIKELSENDVKPIGSLFEMDAPLNIACYKRETKTDEQYYLIEEKIPDIHKRGTFQSLILKLDAFVTSKMKEGDRFDDFVFRTYPSTFYLIDIEKGEIPKATTYDNEQFYFNNVYIFKISLEYDIPMLEFWDYKRDSEAEQRTNIIKVVNNSNRHIPIRKCNVPFSKLSNCFYFVNPYSLYLDNMTSETPELDKRLYNDAFPSQVDIILSDYAKQAGINNSDKTQKLVNRPSYKMLKEFTKRQEKINENGLTSYKAKKISKEITNKSVAQLEKIITNNGFAPPTFINNVYKARVARRLNTIRKRTPENINIISTTMALSDNIPFFENE